MSQAIQIKLLGPTNTKGSRLKATAQAGSITQGRDYELNAEDQAMNLAVEFCRKYDWPMPVGFGVLPSGDFVATLDKFEK